MGQLSHNTSHQYCASDEIEIGVACSAYWGGGVGRKRPGVNGSRSDVRSTRGPGPTMTARGQSIGIGGDYGTKDIQVLHYGI